MVFIDKLNIKPTNFNIRNVLLHAFYMTNRMKYTVLPRTILYIDHEDISTIVNL